MARARCVTAQRDNALMLDAWLRYHGHLVGFRNLVVHDEGSSDPATVALLRRAELAGTDVRRHGGGASLNAHARSLASETQEEGVIVPLAIAEFLAVYTDDGISCGRDQVTNVLEQLREKHHRLTPAPALASVAVGACEFSVADAPQPVLRTGGDEAGESATRLTCLRFAGLAADPSALRIVFQGFGFLLDALGVQHDLFASPVTSPRKAPPDAVWVRSAPDGNTLRFVGRDYLRANEDMTESGWPPLLHYALAGVQERRSLR